MDPVESNIGKAQRDGESDGRGKYLAAGAGGVAFAPTRMDLGNDPDIGARLSRQAAGGSASVADLRSGAAVGDGLRVGNRAHTARLALKIKREGFDSSNPLRLLRYKDGSVKINEGHHRLRAAEMLGHRSVPVHVSDVDSSKPRTWVPLAMRGVHRKRLADARKPEPQLPSADLKSLAQKRTGLLGSAWNKANTVVDPSAALTRLSSSHGGKAGLAAAGGAAATVAGGRVADELLSRKEH